MRRRVVSALKKALKTSSEPQEPHVPAKTHHIARAIEEALYGLYASEVCNGYIQQARVLKANFKSNSLLRGAVLGRNTEVCVMAPCCSCVFALGLFCSCFPDMARRRAWQHNDKREREREYLSLLSGQALAIGSGQAGQASAHDKADLLVAIAPANFATPQRKIARAQARSEDLFQRCIPVALLALPVVLLRALLPVVLLRLIHARPMNWRNRYVISKTRRGVMGPRTIPVCAFVYACITRVSPFTSAGRSSAYCHIGMWATSSGAAHTPGAYWVRLQEQTDLGSHRICTLLPEQNKC
jgi:hypothetical protein